MSERLELYYLKKASVAEQVDALDLKSNVRKDVPVRLWIGPPFNNNKFIVIDLLLLKGIIEKDYIDLLIAWTLVRIQPFNEVECSSEVEHEKISFLLLSF